MNSKARVVVVVAECSQQVAGCLFVCLCLLVCLFGVLAGMDGWKARLAGGWVA
jgi:hypothetical protein